MDVEQAFRSHWQVLWTSLGRTPADAESLLARYGEAHRHYHNAAHIVDCLDQFTRYGSALKGADASPEISLALFYHDAIYDPAAADNEQQSARLAQQHLSPHLQPAQIKTITRLIVATDHRRPLADPAERLIVDIDLSILGRDPITFDIYDRAIRAEYAHVPEEAYRVGRSKVLQGFLARPRLYSKDWFFERYEAAARINLARAITQLSE